MIEFNQETRQFARIRTEIFEPTRGYVASGSIGGAAGYIAARATEAELRKKYLAEGKTPDEVEALLAKRRKRMLKSGAGMGLGARFVAGRIKSNFKIVK